MATVTVTVVPTGTCPLGATKMTVPGVTVEFTVTSVGTRPRFVRRSATVA